MTFQIEFATKRENKTSGIDFFFTALLISITLHIAATIILALLPESKPEFKAPPKKKPYVIHLIDPGTLASASRPLSQAKTKRKSDRFHAPSKKSALAKEVSKVKKKVVKTKHLKGKTTKKVKAVDKKIADIIKKKKTGGIIDIQKFPYEWYLRMMESKIYGNWETLSIDFSAERNLHALVYFKINRRGEVFGLKLEKATLVEEYDRSALEAIKLASPFPPLPPGYEEDYLEVHFGFKVKID